MVPYSLSVPSQNWQHKVHSVHKFKVKLTSQSVAYILRKPIGTLNGNTCT